MTGIKKHEFIPYPRTHDTLNDSPRLRTWACTLCGKTDVGTEWEMRSLPLRAARCSAWGSGIGVVESIRALFAGKVNCIEFYEQGHKINWVCPLCGYFGARDRTKAPIEINGVSITACNECEERKSEWAMQGKKPIDIMLDRVGWEEVDNPKLGDDVPCVTAKGILMIAGLELEVYQLDDGRRIIDEDSMHRFLEYLTGKGELT